MDPIIVRCRSQVRPTVAVLVGVACAAVLGCGNRSRPPTTNVTPAVEEAPATSDRAASDASPSGYVGDASCAACHEQISRQYASHSMGRSLAPVAAAASLPPADVNAAFEADGFRYQVLRQGDAWVHRQARLAIDGEEMAVIEQPVHFVVGSGNHGQSFLIDHDGYLFMSPMTWYPDKQIWHFSPGYEENNSQFNRPVVEICLFCHSNRAPKVSQTLNRYSPPIFDGHAIGCERRHGPGRRHVEQQSGNTVADNASEPNIVNPARLAPRLREAVCQQCHLSGVARILRPDRDLYDFRPGDALESCFSIFVLRPEHAADERFVGQVEQMYASRCYQASEGRLGCISCHDPHQLPAAEEKTDFYRRKCLACHDTGSCHLDESTRRAQSAADSCILCHMPTLQTEVRHAATTNHRIPRRADSDATDSVNSPKAGDHFPLVRFGDDHQESAVDRDLAIALVRAAQSFPELIGDRHRAAAAAALEQVTRQQPQDVMAHQTLGDLQLASGKPAEALRAYQHVLTLEPENEATLSVVADAFNRMGNHGHALSLWQRLIRLNPWMSRYWYGLAQAYAGTGQWELCRQTAQQAAGRFPTSIGARHLLVESNLRLGNRLAAEEAFQWLRRYQPSGFASLSRWYQQHPLRQGNPR